MLASKAHGDRSLQPSGAKPPQPSLGVPPALTPLLLAVEGAVAACCPAALSAKCLAAELLHFLHLKVATQDTGPVYQMHPPPVIDTAWKALLLETAVAEQVHAALGVDVVHRTARQSNSAAAYAARRCVTFTAAAHAAAQQPGRASAVAVPMPDALFWGVPGHGDLLVQVTLLPLSARQVQHAYMPPQSSVADLAAQLSRVYNIALERFRPTGLGVAPLHPTKLLCYVGAGAATPSSNGGGSDTGGGGGQRTLQLFATPAIGLSSSLSGRAPLPTRVSLQVNEHHYTDLDGRAPLGSLLAGREFTSGGPSHTALTYFYTAEPPRSYLAVDETRPLADFRDARLLTAEVEAPAVYLPLTVHSDREEWHVHAAVLEAWQCEDLTCWMEGFGGATLHVAGAPAPPTLCHASRFTRLDVVHFSHRSARGSTHKTEVFFKDLTGRTHTLQVQLCWAVWVVKGLVEYRTGIPASQQRLIWAGKQLEDGYTMGEYGVCKESTLHLTLRLRGC